jgi:hypothetical protein
MSNFENYFRDSVGEMKTSITRTTSVTKLIELDDKQVQLLLRKALIDANLIADNETVSFEWRCRDNCLQYLDVRTDFNFVDRPE